ncbi:MAG: hypothetical protein ACI4C1_07185 [Lachnospiraceae bacterium]
MEEEHKKIISVLQEMLGVKKTKKSKESKLLVLKTAAPLKNEMKEVRKLYWSVLVCFLVGWLLEFKVLLLIAMVGVLAIIVIDTRLTMLKNEDLGWISFQFVKEVDNETLFTRMQPIFTERYGMQVEMGKDGGMQLTYQGYTYHILLFEAGFFWIQCKDFFKSSFPVLSSLSYYRHLIAMGIIAHEIQVEFGIVKESKTEETVADTPKLEKSSWRNVVDKFYELPIVKKMGIDTLNLNQKIVMASSLLMLISLRKSFASLSVNAFGVGGSQKMKLSEFIELSGDSPDLIIGMAFFSCMVVIVAQFLKRKSLTLIGCAGMILADIFIYLQMETVALGSDFMFAILEEIGIGGGVKTTLWGKIILIAPFICLVMTLIKPISSKKKGKSIMMKNIILEEKKKIDTSTPIILKTAEPLKNEMLGIKKGYWLFLVVCFLSSWFSETIVFIGILALLVLFIVDYRLILPVKLDKLREMKFQFVQGVNNDELFEMMQPILSAKYGMLVERDENGNMVLTFQGYLYDVLIHENATFRIWWRMSLGKAFLSTGLGALTSYKEYRHFLAAMGIIGYEIQKAFHVTSTY